jgi:tyrosyl-tRNA synthetase
MLIGATTRAAARHYLPTLLLLRTPAALAATPTPAPMILRRLAAPSPARAAARAAGSPLPAAAIAIAARRALASRAAAAAQAAEAATTTPTPSKMPHNVVAVLRSRGLVQDVTGDDLERDALQGPLTVYCGFDPTADSLHLGNLLGIVVLAWFLRCGHKPLALLGGATARVGDPSGRQTERPVLSEQEIESNAGAIGSTLRDILQRAAAGAAAEGGGGGGGAAAAAARSAPPEVRVLNNLDWFGPMSLLTFLREVGKHARVGTMMAKDSVKSRMAASADGGVARMAASADGGDSGSDGGNSSSSNSGGGGGLSFTEFTYQLLQGYDYVHLARNEGVRVQVGGSDQWGNITAGTDLIRRLGAASASPSSPASSSPSPSSTASYHGLTFPLLVDAEGRKVGKSTATGAVWLSAARLSPYRFYQALFATADADVGRFLRMLTFLPLAEVEQIESAMRQNGYVPNTAQRRLAEEVTRFVHGDEGLAQALRATEALRPGGGGEGGGGGGAGALDAATLEAIAGDAPTAELARVDLVSRPVVDVVVAAGLLKSKGEARRMVKNGGVYVNNVKVAGEDATVAEADLIDGRVLLLAAGKKNKMLVRVV